jgi:hypothetical protein
MSIKFIHCMLCGRVELSQGQYNLQMARANSLWRCPNCGNTAAFAGEYSPCPKCAALVSHDRDTCQQCGIDQYEAYMEDQSDDV